MQEKTAAVTMDARPRSLQDKSAEATLVRRIARGITGSFLISVVTVPFGYLISLILARISPEVVGAYSLLGIYLGIVSGLIYFGGGTVTVRFMSELPTEKKSSFFFSYYLLTLGLLAFLTGTVLVFPGVLKFIFGSSTDTREYLFLFFFAPLPLFYFSAVATLRGQLQVTLAQFLTRALTVGSCLVFGYFLLTRKDFFNQYPGQVIFVSYFFLMLVASAFAFQKVRKEIGLQINRWRWYLPAGFWGYVLGVQGASTLGLLHMKIDQILVLREFDLAQLGIFFVILQIAEASPLLAMFFVEGVLPGMTNLLAAQRLDRIRGLYQKVARYMVLMATGLTCFLLAFSQPLLSFFGEEYLAAHSAFLLLVIFSNFDSLGPLNHTAMLGLNRPNYWSLTQLIRIVVFLGLFSYLTEPLGLIGAVLARSIAWSAAGIFGYYVVLRRLQIRLRIPTQYFLSVAISLGVAALSYTKLGNGDLWGWRLLLFSVSLGSFAILGRYGFKDLREARALFGKSSSR